MGPKKILIADDDADIRDLLAIFLRKSGFEVVEVDEGRSAVSEALKGGFELILMDVMMPGIDGYHAAAEISEKMGSFRPKILIMTSRNLDVEQGIVVLSGADASIQKPFKLEDVKAKIETLLAP